MLRCSCAGLEVVVLAPNMPRPPAPLRPALQVFQNTKAAAALAAGIFHREEVAIQDVKAHLHTSGIPARLA